ncbi:hypothetical protein ACFSTH_08750 [Paenibacillus yanchengensis]|uniref:DUF3888 domain-containing protein n=1 Tax=Paenibacillus yanchengensis TaxID=2035833 RepID=A0ABW4YLA7_9BACL
MKQITNNKGTRKFLVKAICCILTLFLIGQAHYPVAALSKHELPVISTNEKLHSSIQKHIENLQNDTTFTGWATATINVYPLGPGTSSWLAVLSDQTSELGYIIIESKDSTNYDVVEYGIGKYDPTFADHISLLHEQHMQHLQYKRPFLNTSMQENQLELNTFFTNDPLPINYTDWIKEVNSYKQLSTTYPTSSVAINTELIKHTYLQSFDPYDRLPWLTQEPLFTTKQWTTDNIKSLQSKLKTMLDKNSHIRFVTEMFDQQLLEAYSITGYHDYGEQLFIKLYQPSDTLILERFIPLPELILFGQIYL